MFFPEKVVEVNVLTVEDFLKDLSNYLIKFGEFEIKRVNIKEAYNLAKIDDGKDNDFEKFSELKVRLDRLAVSMGVDDNRIKKTLDEREPMSLSELDMRLTKAENEFYSASGILSNLEKEEIDLRFKKLQYSISKDLESRGGMKEFFTAMIVVPKYELSPIVKNLSSIPSIVREVEDFKDMSVILVSVPLIYKSEILKLSTSFLKFVDVGSIKYEYDIEEIERRLKEIEIEKKKLKSMLDKIIEMNTDEVLSLYRGLWFVNASMKIKSSSIRGKKFIVFSGWIPKSRQNEVIENVKNITKDTCIIEVREVEKVLKEDKTVQVPTKLNNPRVLSPFESLVKLYAIPKFYEIDPTIIFAFLYVLFYGMMFGDVGQGLVLLLLSAILFWKFKNFRVIAGVGIAVGISAAIFGFLYGSVFGIEEKIIPAMWTSPLHDVLRIMKVSVAIGFIVIFVGLVLNAINTVREKNILKFLLGSKGVSGIVFYTFLIGYPLYLLVFGGSFNGNLMLWGVLIPTLMFIIEAVVEAKKHGHRISPVTIFFELFEVFISFVSNTISFVRIAGFALNHTALMITFFSIANVIKGTTIGDIVAFFVVVFGQIFIIVFEGFIVGIQSLRLSFYEFFTKFFRGGGKAFEPLR